MSNKKTFKHSGDLGDVIFSLPTIRALGGGILYLDPKGGKKEPLVTWAGGMFEKTKLNKKGIDSIKELLEHQDYIDEVRYWEGEEVDHNLDQFRLHIRFNNLADSHLTAFNLPLEERDEPWLTVPSSVIDDLERDVVIARSCRYHGNYSFWETIDRGILEKAFFLGYKKEYEYFKYTYPHMKGIPYREVKDLLEMAQIISGADLFVGNQGLPHAIAEGLKKPLINEVFRPYPAAVFNRPETKYV
jgi:hypothetical protein